MESPSPATGVAFLASGSRGNATLAYHDGRGVLIDCGISAREVRRRIAETGLGSIEIEAVLITHEHGDHVAGVRVLTRTLGIPVFATRGTAGALREQLSDVPEIVTVRAGESFRTSTFGVLPFRTSHDVAEPVGYAIESVVGHRVGIATDTGVLTAEAIEAIGGCDLLGLEANHDLDMLERGPYPRFLKDRIRSDRGHLSNACAARGLELLGSDRLRTIVAMHISEQNNLPRLAMASVGAQARSLGLAADVLVARQTEAIVCEIV
ncbi:MAG: MBL fold metallo-hydrolase [Actinobacteria bacterium]|nr:MAG: MBL fold metallo-hydrolase [Actinomycetota bacterium]